MRCTHLSANEADAIDSGLLLLLECLKNDVNNPTVEGATASVGDVEVNMRDNERRVGGSQPSAQLQAKGTRPATAQLLKLHA